MTFCDEQKEFTKEDYEFLKKRKQNKKLKKRISHWLIPDLLKDPMKNYLDCKLETERKR